jgi:hypothetical protein
MSAVLRRTLAVFVPFVLCVTFAGSSASAATIGDPGTYRAKADASALEINLLGNLVSLGKTHADNASDPIGATASGIGALVLSATQGEQDSAATADGQDDTKAEVCGPVALPSPLNLDTACSDSSAKIAGLPSSSAHAHVARLDVDLTDLLGQLPVSTITGNVNTLLNALNPIFTQLQNAGIDAESLLSQLIDAIAGGHLITVTVGPSSASTAATDGGEMATATAQGAVIDVLPRVAPLQPVIKIEVGAASNTVTVDRATGQATVVFSPSIVTATIAPDIAAALPALPNPISVTPGVSQCLGLPAPLDSCITVGGGTQSTLADGATHADAAGVSLQLLNGLPGGGVSISLAKTSVEALAVAPAAPTTTEAPTTAPPITDLARTGGESHLATVGLLVSVATGGYVLTSASRRRRRVL